MFTVTARGRLQHWVCEVVLFGECVCRRLCGQEHFFLATATTAPSIYSRAIGETGGDPLGLFFASRLRAAKNSCRVRGHRRRKFGLACTTPLHSGGHNPRVVCLGKACHRQSESPRLTSRVNNSTTSPDKSPQHSAHLRCHQRKQGVSSVRLESAPPFGISVRRFDVDPTSASRPGRTSGYT